MLIGFMGAGGTGKTTMAKLLANDLNIPFIPSSSRAVFERRGLTETDQYKMTPKEQLDLQMEIFHERILLEATISEGVADRTLLDQVAYSILRAGSALEPDMVTNLILQAHHHLKKYDRLFYFPLTTFPGSDDRMRDTSYGTRYTFNSIIYYLQLASPFDVHAVPVQPIEERLARLHLDLSTLPNNNDRDLVQRFFVGN